MILNPVLFSEELIGFHTLCNEFDSNVGSALSRRVDVGNHVYRMLERP
jgi:hypothetical protein